MSRKTREGRKTRDGRVLACAAAVLLAAPLVAACAPAAAPALSLTSATAPPDFATAIAVARAARDRAALLRAPTPADFAADSDEPGESPTGDDAIAGTLRQWAATRRDATQDAHRLYTEALHSAEEPAEEAAAYAELAELWLQMEEDTRSALFAATPAEYRDDPSLVSAVQGATVYALRPLLDRVESHLGACERVARDVTPSGAGADAVTACAHVAARLRAASDPRGPSAPSASAAAAPIAQPAVRPVLPTTHPKPCTFEGTLRARGTVYASETGSAAVLTLDPSSPIEVASLAVPTAPGGRYKVTVRWPTAAEGYLETDDGPFVLARRVDLPSNTADAADAAHEASGVWAAEGARVGASEARGPTVRVARPKEIASERDTPVDRRLFCHDLELAIAPR